MAIINRKTLTQQLEDAKAQAEAISQGLSAIPSQYRNMDIPAGTELESMGYGGATPTMPIMPSQSAGQGSQTGTQLDTSGGQQSIIQSMDTSNMSPLQKFNMSIMGMLEKAQSASDPTKLYEQQKALQRSQLDQAAEITPEDQRVLSPSQQAAIRSGKTEMLEPEIDAVAARIKSQDYRLRNFESMLDSARSLGKEFFDTIAIKPDKEIIEGYTRMMRAGGNITSIPVEIRNDIIGKLSNEDWKAHDAAERTGGSSGTPPTSYKEWSLAGGKEGTGLEYADYLTQQKPSKYDPEEYVDMIENGNFMKKDSDDNLIIDWSKIPQEIRTDVDKALDRRGFYTEEEDERNWWQKLLNR